MVTRMQWEHTSETTPSYFNQTTTVNMSNVTDVHDHGHHDHPEFLEDNPWEIPLAIVEGILCVIILIGNGLVIAAYIRSRRLRTVTHFFLVNLVISDFIVGLTIPVHISTYFIPPEFLTHSICVLRFAIVGKCGI